MNRTEPFAPFYPFLVGLALLAVAASSCSGPASAKPATSELRHYSVTELVRILEAEGYGSVTAKETHVSFKADGRHFTLFRYPDGDLQMFFGIAGPRVPLEDMNRWNREYRLSRAYVDDEQDPVLEADLLANAGLNARIITEFVLVFIESSREFQSFVAQHDQAATPQTVRDTEGESA